MNSRDVNSRNTVAFTPAVESHCSAGDASHSGPLRWFLRIAIALGAFSATFTSIDVPLATSRITVEVDGVAEAGERETRQLALSRAYPVPQPESGWRYTSEGWRKTEDLQSLAGRRTPDPNHLQRIHPLTVSILQILGVIMVLLLSTDSKATQERAARRQESSDLPRPTQERHVDQPVSQTIS